MTSKPEISVAPMMDWTDRHCRYFHRLISPNALLYTEMITTGALLHGDAERFLRFDESEHPVALQLGGSDPADLAVAAKMGETRGYDEINLNCGCPSDRVQNGRFGACLMGEPDHVAACVEAMMKAVDIPVTVKCRIGIDEQDSFEFLDEFVSKIADKGCETFIIHARKAWLSGLSPKENRTVPPIHYDRVLAIKDKHPHLRIIVNGEIKTVEQIKTLLPTHNLSRNELQREMSRKLNVSRTGSVSVETTTCEPEAQKHLIYRPFIEEGLDGAMIGREAYSTPYFLAEIEREVFENHDILEREAIAHTMADYAATQFEQFGTPAKSITRHILGLFHHQPGAKAWKRYLSENAHLKDADHTVILEALGARETSIEAHLENTQ